MKGTFEQIVDDLRKLDFFSEFKFRKRDNSLYRKTDWGWQGINLRHWRGDENKYMCLRPVYKVRFNVLHKWYEGIGFKMLQDQRDTPTRIWGGQDFEEQAEFTFRYDMHGYNHDFNNFAKVLTYCAEEIFSKYSTLESLYELNIQSVLDGKQEFPDVGMDWFFNDIALCKLVAPEEYDNLKQRLMHHLEWMRGRREPNLAHYYDRLDEIFHTIETIKLQ